MTKRLPFDITVDRQLDVEQIRLADIDAMRLVLRGGSVINWYRQSFRSSSAVNQFLRVNGLDPSEPESQQRIRHIIRESADYIHRSFHYGFPPEVVDPERVENLFLRASSHDEHQKLACMVLKVAHVLHHLEGYELRHCLPTSDQTLFDMASAQIDAGVETLRQQGVQIAEYQASVKTRDSLITKLLSKRRTIAAQIFDKLRFRILTPTRGDLVPLLCGLTRTVLPFNYVIPGESRNDILDLRGLAEGASEPRFGSIADSDELPASIIATPPPPHNPFSASAYQVINFVVDLPVRVDRLLDELAPDAPAHLGRVVFVPVEFQLLDKETFEANERGPANHALYKRRQRQTVLKRLVWGQRVPAVAPPPVSRPAPPTGSPSEPAPPAVAPKK